MKKKKYLLTLVLAVLCLISLLLPKQDTQDPTTPDTTAPTHFQPEAAGFRVHFLDVGQADCALLECDGVYALIDGGNTEDGSAVIRYLRDQGVQRLNLVVGTHPHEDHIGGLKDVLAAFPADNIWSGHISYYNSVVYSFINGAKAQSKELQYVKPGATFALGSATIEVIGPVKTDYEDVNDRSLVLMVTYGQNKFLFTGDMERIAEQDLLNSGADVKADVLKVGHHGSYSSTSYLFLRSVMPTYGVISCGRNNDYGHPHADPLSRLKDADVTIFRTDELYTIVAASDGRNIRFTWGNEAAEPWTPNAA